MIGLSNETIKLTLLIGSQPSITAVVGTLSISSTTPAISVPSTVIPSDLRKPRIAAATSVEMSSTRTCDIGAF